MKASVVLRDVSRVNAAVDALSGSPATQGGDCLAVPRPPRRFRIDQLGGGPLSAPEPAVVEAVAARFLPQYVVVAHQSREAPTRLGQIREILYDTGQGDALTCIKKSGKRIRDLGTAENGWESDLVRNLIVSRARPLPSREVNGRHGAALRSSIVSPI